jgi:alpha-L-arabinofuranosidase
MCRRRGTMNRILADLSIDGFRFLFRLLIFIQIITGLCIGCISYHSKTGGSTFTVDVLSPGAEVAPIQLGQELEEFNHGIQGGLFAQMINNPSFEEVVNDSGIPYPTKYWGTVVPVSSAAAISGQTSANTSMLNSHQVHCVKLSVTSIASGSVGLKNDGFWGMKLENNTIYQVSFWAKKGSNFAGTLKATLESSKGKVYASQSFTPTPGWKHYTCNLITNGILSVNGNNRFVIYASTTGDVYFDVITIMPPTWKDHGCRIDVAQKVDSLHLKFIDYPGGFDAHWSTPKYARMWKESIGHTEQRGGSTSFCWGYKNDLYFGTDEYFQLAEDLGAEPCYVFSAGIFSDDCTKLPVTYMSLDSVKSVLIPDCLDFMQYCNGDTATYWGARRKTNGHAAPYNLQYVQIGAENNHRANDSAAYAQRYRIIHDSLIAHYPDLKIAFNGHMRGEAYSTAEGQPCSYVDDHFLRSDNSTKYDWFDDGHYPDGIIIKSQENDASHRGMAKDVVSDFQDAMVNSAFWLGMEKNSRRMWWTGFGNFGSVVNHGDFGDNLLNFDAVTCFASPSYYVQKMLFSDNHGTRVLPFTQNAPDCFWSASIDTENGNNDVLLKVVNYKSASETVDITLKGTEDVNKNGISTILKAALDDTNSIDHPYKVVPVKGRFEAGSSFKYTFPAYSITVLRIGILTPALNPVK